MNLDRRSLIAAAASLAATPTLAEAAARQGAFPKGFRWGVATAGHQIEGANINADSWVLEHVKPTIYAESSGDAANSFLLWRADLDLVKSLGFNTYRFSLEWSRIEPAKGEFSIAMLDHYKAIIDGCLARGLAPMVTFNHFTAPIWFSAQGGWTNPQSPELFARFCERAARHLSADIAYATTLNEPNIGSMLEATMPEIAALFGRPVAAMLKAAGKSVGSDNFVPANAMTYELQKLAQPNLIAGHKAARIAMKSVRPDLPVGLSLAIADDQVGDSVERRDKVRAAAYEAWLEAARDDDFIGVQNYARNVWDASGSRKPPKGSVVNSQNIEVYPNSLAGAVRYAHEKTGRPVMVTEHGVAAEDDAIRAYLIKGALAGLKSAMDDGVPVLGYLHWSLLDNFEWLFGYGPKFGLCAFDRKTFERKPKPSARVLGAIAKRNRL